MRRKRKLIFSIIAAIIILILMGFGIWGAMANIGIGGDITFDAEALEVSISGKMYGHNKDNLTEETAENLPGATWTKEMAENGEDYYLDWSGLNLWFADKDNPIVIEIYITNNHDDSDIVVAIENNTITEGKNFTFTLTTSGTAQNGIIGVGETLKCLITMSIVDANFAVSGNIDLNFSLASGL